MNEEIEAIKLLVAPVVMISACGLLCLALYNRLAVIVARARAFNKERVECLDKVAGGDLTPAEERSQRARAGILDAQFTQILARARHVRRALGALLTTVNCMLGCSLALGSSVLVADAAAIALGLFILGVLAALVGMICAMLELKHALDPVSVEETSIHEHHTL